MQGLEYQPIDTEPADPAQEIRGTLFPIDELMSRDERSITQYSMMRNSHVQRDMAKMDSFINPQPTIVEPSHLQEIV